MSVITGFVFFRERRYLLGLEEEGESVE